jgi:hypothetical protein
MSISSTKCDGPAITFVSPDSIRRGTLSFHEMIRLLELLLHVGTMVGGWSTKQIHGAILDRFELTAGAYNINSLRYGLRKLKGHGLLEREEGRYAYRLTN